jgi:hypothetical protein
MIKVFKASSIFKILPVFVLLGFFACVVHIVPQSNHIVNSRADHGTTQVACVDHQVSLSSSQKDHSNLFQIAILPNTNIVPELFSSNLSVYTPDTYLYAPPNKTALYIKNNTFLI